MHSRVDPTLIPSAPDLCLENIYWQQGLSYVAGLDEAGRGAWAGPVAAAAIVFSPSSTINFDKVKIRDSKQLSPQERADAVIIIKQAALEWGVGFASCTEIDQLGILPATRLAMARALQALRQPPDHLLIDALFLPDLALPQTALVKGDQRSLSIAAASILAKTARDEFMVALDAQEPGYGFSRHKGYGTKLHQAALKAHGPCSQHRLSFAPLRTIR